MEPSNGVVSQHTGDAELRMGVRITVLSATEAAQPGLVKRALLPGGRDWEAQCGTGHGVVSGGPASGGGSNERRLVVVVLLVGPRGLSHLGLCSPLSRNEVLEVWFVFARPSRPAALITEYSSRAP